MSELDLFDEVRGLTEDTIKDKRNPEIFLGEYDKHLGDVYAGDDEVINLTSPNLATIRALTTTQPTVRTVFVKPENAINVPEKYKVKPGSVASKKSVDIEGLKKEKEFIKTEDVIKGEELKNNTIYDVDPRQAAVGHGTDQIDLSKFLSSSVKQDPELSTQRKKVRKVIKGKKKPLRDLKPKPLRKVFPKSTGEVKRVKFGTRVIPKKVYDPLSL